VTARTDDQTPSNPAPGVELAESSGAANRLLVSVPPADVQKTVLVKEQAKPPAKEVTQ
jgi:hypothetical protein